MTPRSVEWPHYHVWTDALRGRDLAREAPDEWDRGTFVRWSIQSAWTAFEEEVRVTLRISYYGSRFWDKFDDALKLRGITPPSRASDLWQRMASVYMERKKYAHLSTVNQDDLLLADSTPAAVVIATIREGIHALHALLGSTAPEWIDDDVLPRHRTSQACLTIGQGLHDHNDPRNIRITYLYRGRESTPTILPPEADPEPAMLQVIRDVIIPISRVRAYQDGEVVAEISVRMRGSSTA